MVKLVKFQHCRATVKSDPISLFSRERTYEKTYTHSLLLFTLFIGPDLYRRW